jgi:hypothetical protein
MVSILWPTTTIALLAATQDDSPDDADDWGGAPDPETGYTKVATGIRAHLSAPNAAASFASEGSSVTAQYRLLADPCDIIDNMRIRDEVTGLEYQVDWCLPRPEPMAHVVAGISRTTSTS